MITPRPSSVRPSVHLPEPTFWVKGFNFVTILCFIPLRYIINLSVRELIALKPLNPYGNLQWDVAPKPELLESPSVRPTVCLFTPLNDSSETPGPNFFKLYVEPCVKGGLKICKKGHGL